MRELKLLFSMADCFCFDKVRWELLTKRAHLPEYDLIFTTTEWKKMYYSEVTCPSWKHML